MRRQRGVALIVAMLALALALLLVLALLDRGEATQARLRDGWRAEQSWQLLRGLEAWAAEGLLADQRASGAVDSLDEAWAREIAPVDIPGAQLRGRLRDLGGCFNVNSLAPAGVADEAAVQRFARLIKGLQLPPAIAAQAADYLDGDGEVRAGGAEDPAYAGLPPSSRAANAALADASELKRLPAMSTPAWERLAPLLCALPADQRINLNTAPAELWLTLDDGVTLAMAKRLVRAEARAFPDLAAVQAALAREGVGVLVDLTAYDVGSRYFRAEAEILADGIPFTYTSVLQRGRSEVRVIARARGGDHGGEGRPAAGR